MRKYLQELAERKVQVQVNFGAANAGKLISISGFVSEVGDDFALLKDIYQNTLLVPLASIAYVEIKK